MALKGHVTCYSTGFLATLIKFLPHKKFQMFLFLSKALKWHLEVIKAVPLDALVVCITCPIL